VEELAWWEFDGGVREWRVLGPFLVERVAEFWVGGVEVDELFEGHGLGKLPRMKPGARLWWGYFWAAWACNWRSFVSQLMSAFEPRRMDRTLDEREP
jgi:hypothetical protein